MVAKTAAITKPKGARPAPVAAPSEKPVDSFQVGQFSFDLEDDVAIPAAATPTASPNALPFKTLFDRLEAKGGGHFFLPDAFWTAPKANGGREVDPEKVTSTYVRTKIRGAFNEWKAKGESAREPYTLVVYPRKAGDDDGRFKEAGYSVYLVTGDKSSG